MSGITEVRWYYHLSSDNETAQEWRATFTILLPDGTEGSTNTKKISCTNMRGIIAQIVIVALYNFWLIWRQFYN
jgi:hypothetical protein